MLFRPLIWLSTNSSRVCAFAFGKSFSAASSVAVFCAVDVAAHLHERVQVLRRLVLAVEGLARERDIPERRAAGGWLEDALHLQLQRLPRGNLDGDRRADAQVVVLGVGVVDECTVGPERGERPLASLPSTAGSAPGLRPGRPR